MITKYNSCVVLDFMPEKERNRWLCAGTYIAVFYTKKYSMEKTDDEILKKAREFHQSRSITLS